MLAAFACACSRQTSLLGSGKTLLSVSSSRNQKTVCRGHHVPSAAPFLGSGSHSAKRPSAERSVGDLPDRRNGFVGCRMVSGTAAPLAKRREKEDPVCRRARRCGVMAGRRPYMAIQGGVSSAGRDQHGYPLRVRRSGWTGRVELGRRFMETVQHRRLCNAPRIAGTTFILMWGLVLTVGVVIWNG